MGPLLTMLTMMLIASPCVPLQRCAERRRGIRKLRWVLRAAPDAVTETESVFQRFEEWWSFHGVDMSASLLMCPSVKH